MDGLANLSQCMTDGDPGATGRARRLRGKALAISVFVEVAVVVSLLLWPLLTPAVLPAELEVTPAPHYSPVGDTRRVQPHIHGDPGIRIPVAGNTAIHPTQLHRDYAQDSSARFEPDPGVTGAPAYVPLVPGSGPDIPAHHGGEGSGPVQVSKGVMEGRLVYRVQPVYPRTAVILHLAGTVVLRAVIAKDGSVQQLEVVTGNPILAGAARDAVRQWRYQPTLLSGQPVEVETEITVSFVMQ